MLAQLLKAKLVWLAAATLLLAVGCEKSDAASETDNSQSEASATANSGLTEATTDIDDGGISEVPTDPALIEKGKELYSAKTCTACHQMDSKMVGPALRGVTERRSAAWLAQMIMHPEQMNEKDPVAKKLLEEHGSPMTNLSIKPDEAKAIIAYLGSEN
jgi:cytochrome c